MKSYFCILALVVAGAYAQTPPSRAIGSVTAVDAGAKQLTLKTDSGENVSVVLQDRTTYYKVGLDLDMKKAVKITLADVATGDRVAARGAISDDKKTVTAASIVVMSQADVAKKHEAEEADWKSRGVSGVITSVNPDSKELVISVRTREGQKPWIVGTSGKVDMRRYAPDSIRFSDAKPSTFADLKVGDQVRVLGNKNEDGTRITPEYIVSGTFRNVAAQVISVDAAAKTIKVTDLDTKKPALVKIEADSKMHRLPPNLANMLAMRLKGGAGGPGGPGAGGFRPGAGNPGGNTGGPAGGPGASPAGASPGGRSGDIEQMLEHIPVVQLTDLKPGDALIISSTAGAEPDKITAITVLAGVEPILTSAPKGRQGMVLGNWNLGGGGMPE
jgi:hypothetical protein